MAVIAGVTGMPSLASVASIEAGCMAHQSKLLALCRHVLYVYGLNVCMCMICHVYACIYVLVMYVYILCMYVCMYLCICTLIKIAVIGGCCYASER